MQVRVEPKRGAVVVVAVGELDAYIAPQLDEAFKEAACGPKLVVDLSSVSFMDSTALGVIARAVRDFGEDHGTRVVLPRTPARRIFEITTLDRVLPVSDSLEEALGELCLQDELDGNA